MLAQCSIVSVCAAELKPSDPSTPLLKIYEPKFTSAGSRTERAKAELVLPPLLIISSVRDLILAKDNKSVMLGLTEVDTKKFAEMTRRFDQKYLVVAATDDTMEVIHITAPIEDGYISFKHPEAAAMAEYLRQRFHLAEFK
jgi:hypothetical protein